MAAATAPAGLPVLPLEKLDLLDEPHCCAALVMRTISPDVEEGNNVQHCRCRYGILAFSTPEHLEAQSTSVLLHKAIGFA